MKPARRNRVDTFCSRSSGSPDWTGGTRLGDEADVVIVVAVGEDEVVQVERGVSVAEHFDGCVPAGIDQDVPVDQKAGGVVSRFGSDAGGAKEGDGGGHR